LSENGVAHAEVTFGDPMGPGLATDLMLPNELSYAPAGQQTEELPGPCHVRHSLDGRQFAGWEAYAAVALTKDMPLRQCASVLLATLTNAHLAGRIDTRLEYDEATRRMAMITLPNSLAGAIWLQFAQAVDARTDFRRCAECRRWFKVAPDAARSDKSYCGGACRARAYRRRKVRA
jgi:hypothetical protein